MTSSNRHKINIASLYRRVTRSRPSPAALPQAEVLLALAEGEHSDATERLLGEVTHSGMHADLLRFAQALAPESARLGVQLERALEVSPADHARSQRRSARGAMPRRNWMRGVASLAAGLAIAIAVWTLQRTHNDISPQDNSAAVAPASDRIFVALDESRGTRQASKPDQIFRTNFRGDEIFKAQFTGG